MQQAAQIRPSSQSSLKQSIARRINEFRLIAQDNVLTVGLIVVVVFVFLFIFLPLFEVIIQSFFVANVGTNPDEAGKFSLEYFARYIDPTFRTHNWNVLRDTMQMGLLSALFGTILGFIFAYTAVRCNVPFPRLFHVFTLLPTISPPFAIAIATILLFGRNGLITKQFLGINFAPGVNDIYGMDGLVFVQTVTFFSVPYLIIRAMLERFDPATEEAALSMGASKFHIFRTITLPLLIPGFASSFLLLFVESLADLGNPLLISGNTTVLSAEIFLAINGEYNQQKGAALSLVLLIPTLTLFLIQNYWVRRRSYISVTGKPTGGQLLVKEPLIRWTFITISTLTLLLVFTLYISILGGSITRLWGIDYSIDFQHFALVFNQGLEAIIDTTFLSAVATPFAGLVGMLIAYMTIRKAFSGKEALDFFSNLGGAVPGIILGIGYIIAFIQAPWWALGLVYAILALYLSTASTKALLRRLAIVVGATAIGFLFALLPSEQGVSTLLKACENITLTSYFLLGIPGPECTRVFEQPLLGLTEWHYVLAVVLLVAAGIVWWGTDAGKRRLVSAPFFGMALFLVIYNLAGPQIQNLFLWSRTLPGTQWPKVVSSISDEIAVFLQPPDAIMGLTFITITIFMMAQVGSRAKFLAGLLALTVGAALSWVGEPLALIGTSYIIIFAYMVRSLPASVRAGVAALQQIDPSIEEASANLGADAQYTFRRITLPLILPAFIAGLIFSFARHMTSLSTIIFLVSGKWRILALEIFDSVERRGLSVAAAFSVVLITIVLIGIGLTYLILGRTLGSSGQRVDFLGE